MSIQNEIKYNRPNCPKCNSDHIVSYGKTWLCKNCKKHFMKTEEDIQNFKPLPTFRGNKPKSKISVVPNVSSIELQEKERIIRAHAEKVRKMCNVDSLIDLPCFLCPDLERNCEVSSCKKMGAWLNNEIK